MKKNMKSLKNISSIVVALLFLSFSAYAGHKLDQEITTPGVGKGPEAGVSAVTVTKRLKVKVPK